MYKHNGGYGAIICNECKVIIKAPCDSTEARWLAAPTKGGGKNTHYCDKHRKDNILEAREQRKD